MLSITAAAAASPVTSPAALKRAGHAVRALFFALGFLSGSWGVHVPSAKAHHGLGEGGLSLALLAAAVGAVLCLGRAGTLVQALGTRRAVLLGVVMAGASLAAVLQVQGLVLLLPLMLVYGAGTALFDVAINADGADLEERGGRKVMSGFHGMWSLGGMVGAALGALLLRWSVPAPLQLAGMAALALATVLLARPALLVGLVPAPGASAGAGDATPPVAGARRLLVILGVLGLSGMLAEGVVYDWSVLWLQQDRGLAPAAAALGYAGFAAAMAANRFAGDWLRHRVAARLLLVASALVGAGAVAAALLVPAPGLALVALAVLGAGLANVVPMVFMAASRVPGVAPAQGIAAVSAMGYVGFVAGPPLMGSVAQQGSLSLAMWLVVAVLLLQALGARWMPR